MAFQFKQFSIDDSNCAMKIGTDGCLLGAWAQVDNTSSILDIGTGSGLIALMLAQRSTAWIDAVEYDADAFQQTRQNFIQSPWSKRLQVFHSSIQEFTKGCRKKYDVIVCCPPYFLNSMKASDKKRRIARHTDTLTFEELITCSIRLIEPDGKFCSIIPCIHEVMFCNIALVEGFYTTSKTYVETKAGADPLRVLLKMQRKKATCKTDSIPILDAEGKSYTKEYMNLTKEFYINF